MGITAADVDHIARLARLGLDVEEREALRHDLESILRYIGKLDELDTTGVEPMAHVETLPTPLREDRAANPERPEDMVRNAPDPDGTFLRVPRVLD